MLWFGHCRHAEMGAHVGNDEQQNVLVQRAVKQVSLLIVYLKAFNGSTWTLNSKEQCFYLYLADL